MNHRAASAAAAALTLVLGALVASSPTSGAEADEPLVAVPAQPDADDPITYDDPALADEDTTTVEGTLRITAFDDVDGGEYRYAIETPDGENVPLELAEDLPLAAADGDIAAEVVDPDSSTPQLAEAEVEPAAAATAAPSAHRAYVVRATGTGALPSRSTINSRIRTGALDEWRADAGAAIPQFTVAGSTDLATSLCGFRGTQVSAVWDAAAAKIRDAYPGVRFDNASGNHLIVLVADSGCGGEGLGIGTVGTSLASGGLTTVVWAGGSSGAVDPITDATVVHELGHNVGLGHANLRACATCAASEYLDVFSVMGFGVAGGAPPALDTAYRDRLGITVPGEVDTLTLPTNERVTAQTRTLRPRGSASGLRGLAVVDPISGRTYWVEHRAGGTTDRDAGSAYVTPRIFPDIDPVSDVVRGRYRFSPGVTVTELDPTGDLVLLPVEAGTTDRGALEAGGELLTPSKGVEVVVDEMSSTAATVTVTVRSDVPRILTGGVAGSARVGAAASTDVVDQWPSGTTFAYEWRADDAVESREPTYTPPPERRGQRLVLTVDVSVPGQPTVRRTSAAAVVGYGRIVGPKVTTSGSLRVGSTVSAVADTVRTVPGGTYSYRWYRSTKPISGAVGRTYKLTAADRGNRIRVQVVARRDGYAQLIRYSPYVGPVR